jgi:hypothetical protein
VSEHTTTLPKPDHVVRVIGAGGELVCPTCAARVRLTRAQTFDVPRANTDDLGLACVVCQASLQVAS